MVRHLEVLVTFWGSSCIVSYYAVDLLGAIYHVILSKPS